MNRRKAGGENTWRSKSKPMPAWLLVWAVCCRRPFPSPCSLRLRARSRCLGARPCPTSREDGYCDSHSRAPSRSVTGAGLFRSPNHPHSGTSRSRCWSSPSPAVPIPFTVGCVTDRPGGTPAPSASGIHFGDASVEDSQLARQAYLIPVVPAFYDFAVARAAGAHPAQGDRFVRRGDAKPVSGMRHGGRPASKCGVAFLDHLVEGNVHIGSRASLPMIKLLELGPTPRRLVRAPYAPHQRILRQQLVNTLDHRFIPDLVKPAAQQRCGILGSTRYSCRSMHTNLHVLRRHCNTNLRIWGCGLLARRSSEPGFWASSACRKASPSGVIEPLQQVQRQRQ